MEHFTETEIVGMLVADRKLPEECRHELKGFISGVLQCVYNATKTDKDITLVNGPDFFGHGYNAVANIFQKYQS